SHRDADDRGTRELAEKDRLPADSSGLDHGGVSGHQRRLMLTACIGEFPAGRADEVASIRRGARDEAFGFQSSHQSVRRGYGNADPVGQFSEAQASGTMCQGAKNAQRADNHLHAASSGSLMRVYEY